MEKSDTNWLLSINENHSIFLNFVASCLLFAFAKNTYTYLTREIICKWLNFIEKKHFQKCCGIMYKGEPCFAQRWFVSKIPRTTHLINVFYWNCTKLFHFIKGGKIQNDVNFCRFSKKKKKEKKKFKSVAYISTSINLTTNWKYPFDSFWPLIDPDIAVKSAPPATKYVWLKISISTALYYFTPLI